MSAVNTGRLPNGTTQRRAPSTFRPAEKLDADSVVRYRLTSGLAVFGSDFFVLTDAGRNAFRVDWRSLAQDDLIKLTNLDGKVLCQANARMARIRESLDVCDDAGIPLAVIRRHFVSPLANKFTIELPIGQMCEVMGSVAMREFSIVSTDESIARVSQRWFRARNSYGIEVAEGQDDPVLLTCVLALDQMVRRTH